MLHTNTHNLKCNKNSTLHMQNLKRNEKFVLHPFLNTSERKRNDFTHSILHLNHLHFPLFKTKVVETITAKDGYETDTHTKSSLSKITLTTTFVMTKKSPFQAPEIMYNKNNRFHKTQERTISRKTNAEHWYVHIQARLVYTHKH